MKRNFSIFALGFLLMGVTAITVEGGKMNAKHPQEVSTITKMIHQFCGLQKVGKAELEKLLSVTLEPAAATGNDLIKIYTAKASAKAWTNVEVRISEAAPEEPFVIFDTQP
jgi:hypothetical protein